MQLPIQAPTFAPPYKRIKLYSREDFGKIDTTEVKGIHVTIFGKLWIESEANEVLFTIDSEEEIPADRMALQQILITYFDAKGITSHNDRLSRVTTLIRSLLRARWESAYIDVEYLDPDANSGIESIHLPPNHLAYWENHRIQRLLRWLNWNPAGSGCDHTNTPCLCTRYGEVRIKALSGQAKGLEIARYFGPKSSTFSPSS